MKKILKIILLILPLSLLWQCARNVPKESAPDEAYASAPLSISESGSYLSGRASRIGESEENEEFLLPENPFVETIIWNIGNCYPTNHSGGFYELINQLEYGEEPDQAIQINELINGFMQNISIESDNLELRAEMHAANWNPEHFLLMIEIKVGLEEQGPLINTEIEVTFSEDEIAAHRLLGYEDIGSELSEPKDRMLGPGEVNYVLYEVIPAKGSSFNRPINIQLLADREDGQVIHEIIVDSPDSRSREFLISQVLAELGLVWRDSEYKSNASIESILEQLGFLQATVFEFEHLNGLLINHFEKE